MDEEHFSWEKHGKSRQRSLPIRIIQSLSEALETWPIGMMKHLLPRIYMIIDEINERFCKGIWFDHQEMRDKIPEMAIIADEQIHMARLSDCRKLQCKWCCTDSYGNFKEKGNEAFLCSFSQIDLIIRQMESPIAAGYCKRIRNYQDL